MSNPIVFIPFSNAPGTTVIDFADFDTVRDYKWRLDTSGYVHRYQPRNPKSVKIYMHRSIMAASDNVQVDHRDHDTLNNQRSNLRLCSMSQNFMNRRKSELLRGNQTSSQFKGVCWSKRDDRWVAGIKLNGQEIHLGHYESETEAARAYNLKAKELFGEFALLNDVPDGPINRIKRGKYRMNRKKSP